jgi:hypothetical protein
MTRKTKIQIATASILLAVIAGFFWFRQDRPEIVITSTGISPNDPNLISFTISNHSKTTFSYGLVVEEPTNGVWSGVQSDSYVSERRISGQSAQSFQYMAHGTNYWRLNAQYHDAFGTPFAPEARKKLAMFAWDRKWERIYHWVYPWVEMKNSYGPKMLGHKPVLPDRK